MKTENWIHGWLKSIWKKKEKHTFKECGCLPDCGCKETKDDKLKGWLP